MSARPEPSVLWREGMLLCPQHLQAFGRELQARIARGESFGWAGAYGLVALEIDAEALGRDVLQVIACDALLRDGTWLRFPELAALEPREFSKLFAKETLDVWVGVPSVQPGVPQLGDGPERSWRYRAVVRVTEDENERDGGRELEFRQLQARLFFGDEERTGYECVRIARLERRGKPVPKSRLLEGDIPPAVACGGSAELMRTLQALAVATRAQARDLARTLPAFDARASAERKIDVLQFANLQAMGRATALLEQLAACPQLHPWEAWRTLLDLIGSFAVFGAARLPPEKEELPAYDHERLGDCFRAALRTLRTLMSVDRQLPYEKVDFAADPGREGFHLADLPAEWLERRWPLWLAVESGAKPDAAAEFVATCLKVIAAGDVEEFLKGVVPGIELVHERLAPVNLPASPERQWFRIDRDPKAAPARDAWLRAEKEKRVALLVFLSSIGPVQFRLYVDTSA